MPRLYNPKRVPVPVSLRDGSSTSIPAKGYLTVPAELWGSADIVRKVKKKLLVQKPDLPVPPPEEPKPETSKKPDVGPKAGEDTPVSKPSTSSVVAPPPKKEEPKAEPKAEVESKASEGSTSSSSSSSKSDSDESDSEKSEKKTGRRRRRSS